MAEVSALTPSPPAMAEQSGSSAPAPLPPDSPKTTPVPKSALYGDRAIMCATTLPSAPRETSVPSLFSGTVNSTPVYNSAPLPVPSENPDTTAERSAPGPVSSAAPAETVTQPAIVAGLLGPVRDQKTPSSPGCNPSPNLCHGIEANQTPNPVSFLDTPLQPPALSSNPAPETNQTAPPSSEAQLARPNQPGPNSSTGSKLDTPNADQGAISPPFSPSKADPPALVVQELPLSFPLPHSHTRPAPDTLSYLESASVMSGTLESLSGLGEDGSSVGSDSEINGQVMRRTDKYGFLGGTQYSEGSEREVSVDVARHREMKWLDMFTHWDKWISRRFPKVKLRCRKGIPSSLRARAWQMLSNSDDLLKSNSGKFEELEREQGDPKWLDIIEKDLHRQFPFHEMFAARGGHGQQDLYRILKAYTVYRPDEGYCQAQAPVAAVLLMHMPAEQAFWCLVQICERYLPGYYSAGLEAIQLDGEIFFSLLRRVCPMAYRHLKKFKIDPILYMTEWFMCIFSRTLPWSCVLRVWDMFFCEGVKIVFRVGLVLLRQMLGSVDKLRELQGMYETMERLRNIPPDSIREDLLVNEVTTVPVTEALIERECSVQVRKWRESRGELTHQPGRRLHGTRDIHEQKRRAASISSGGSFSFLGSPVPPPGPLRASSSLLSLPGFRKSKTPFPQTKKGSFSGASGHEALGVWHGISVAAAPLPVATRPPVPKATVTTGTTQQAPHPPSPLASKTTSTPAPTSAPEARPTPAAPAPMPAPNTLQPKVVSEQVTPTIPSPTANNAPLPPCPAPTPAHAAPASPVLPPPPSGEEDNKKKKKNKEEKKKEKEEEKQKIREKKEREKAEKEKAKKEKDRAEKDKKKEKGGKKKDKGGAAEAEEKNGAAAPKDLP